MKQTTGHEILKISQKAIIYDPSTRKFLLVKSTDRNSQAAIDLLGWWEFVGGRIDDGEEPSESLQREIKEEIGMVDCEIIGAVDANLLRWADKKIFGVGYLVLYHGGDIVISEEHSEFAWVSSDDVEKSKEYGMWVKRYVKAAVERLREREYLSDLQRLQADFANYKKRQQESQKELAGYLIEKLVMEITPVLDNFHMATQHVPADACNTPWVTGIQYIEKQLEKVLEDNGMQVIEAKEGDVFDPSIHEAISEERAEAKDSDPETKEVQQTVKKILQKGYEIGAKVIRPAKVVVG